MYYFFLILKISQKEKKVGLTLVFYNVIPLMGNVDTVFCLPLICMPDPEKSKILFSLHGIVRTPRMTWGNPVGH